MKTQIRLSLSTTAYNLGFKKKTGTCHSNESRLNGLYCGGRKIIRVQIRRGGVVEQTARGCAPEVFADGFGIKVDTKLEGSKPIIAVKDWRQYCHAVESRGVLVYSPKLLWRYMGQMIMWLQPHPTGALHATDHNGHSLYIHASDEALIDD